MGGFWVGKKTNLLPDMLPPPHESPVYRARETGVTPNRSPPGGPLIETWVLRFAIYRLTIANFRDVRILVV